jgi:hypothetical protein
MAADVIPEDIRHFILKNIDSVAQLEALLLMRITPTASWDPATLSRRLYISEQDAEKLATALCLHGLLKAEESPLRYRYEPKNPEYAEKVDRLADLYARYLVPVTALVHGKSNNKVRKFADAFWIRKD